MTRPFRFTGWHMLAVLVAFFGIVIAVNVTMATLATQTFGGVVVENSYVASQHFNRWLKEAHAQDQLGWQLKADAKDGRVTARIDRVAGATVTATARHPLGLLANIELRFTETAPGEYVAQERLPAGRWRVHLHVVRGDARADFIRDVFA